MKRTLSLLSLLLLAAAAIIGAITYRETEDEAGFVKALRDPDRVDQRWLYVTSLGTASVCFGLWALYKRK
jgi:hypothetical protein